MFLCDTDLRAAIADGSLIFDPPPKTIDANSIDLHLGELDEAKIWNVETFRR